ncbi:MAG: hypothetical protein FWE21_05645 [Defluviitaleaceae bacterium]|nr:hypothetical protein [Defluviitaleaceae bacterium]
MTNHIQNYYKSVQELLHRGIESSFNPSTITLLEHFGCKVRDFSGGRKGVAGQNPDLEIWQSVDGQIILN